MMYSSFYVRPSAEEQVQTTVPLRSDTRPALLGTAVDDAGKPVCDALVILYASGGTHPDRVAGVTYTDDMGRFAFGPLDAGVLYQVCIRTGTALLRTLEQSED